MTKILPKKTPKKPVRKTKESVTEVNLNTQLQVAYHFPCPIYIIERPDFLEAVNTISEEALEVERKERDLDEIYPVYMTGSYFGDPRMAEFTQFVGATTYHAETIAPIIQAAFIDGFDQFVEFSGKTYQ